MVDTNIKGLTLLRIIAGKEAESPEKSELREKLSFMLSLIFRLFDVGCRHV